MRQVSAVEALQVSLDFGEKLLPVGRLALRDGILYFEYDAAFLTQGLDISPLKLPLQTGVGQFDRHLFEGLPGIFNDSLPDGWGRLLFDRFARTQGISPASITPLDRLAHVGHHGMGALVYEPDFSAQKQAEDIHLDTLAAQAQEVLAGSSEDVLQNLLALNGSSAGARPKAMIGVDEKCEKMVHGTQALPERYTPWLVKFANQQDGHDAGAIEYVYALMAKKAGIEMPDVHLFPAGQGAGYFAIQRFDRKGKERLHMHTACGLLHTDFRVPALDYEDLLALTGMITKDAREVEKMYRLAVFNVLAHNRDDHAKNFSFLMDKTGQWLLSPAYDLTFSSGPRGEQSTMVLGEGKNPTKEHLLKLGVVAGLNQKQSEDILEKTKAALAEWPQLAKIYGVSQARISEIGEVIFGDT